MASDVTCSESLAARAPETALDASVLDIDCAAETALIAARLVEIVGRVLRRRGVVVAVSGGIDSSVCAALAARAFGRERILALLLPEHDSSKDSTRLGRLVAEHLGLEYRVEDIGPALEAIGCYRWRDEAIRRIFSAYGAGWRSKIVIAGNQSGLTYFKLVVQSPSGETREECMGAQEYLQVVAATNFKQRLRKTLEYFHADRLNYAVIGTPNRLEYDQGFFVKNGDGAADLKPIAHLYKTQVYQLAKYLNVPHEIQGRQPTTDTYSLDQSQEEFYFAVPYDKMDLCLYARNHGLPAAEVADATGLTAEQSERVYQLIDSKRNATRYLHMQPLLVETVCQISS